MDYYTKGGDRDYILTNLQNLRPIFMQEHLATSLCAMCLQPVASDVAALVDLSVPLLDATALVEDIKARLLVDPLAIRDVDLRASMMQLRVAQHTYQLQKLCIAM